MPNDAAPAAPYSLPDLPYGYRDLEPVIDEATMRLHHDKHHRAYVDGTNALLSASERWRQLPIEDVLRRLSELPEGLRQGVRNQGGGHANHSLFWQVLTPRGSSGPKGALAKAIQRDFGSVDQFRKNFQDAGVHLFGSGWVVLSTRPEASFQLEIIALANQDSVLSTGRVPLLACDVWEHAYYLQYNNRRAEWLAAWWEIVSWDRVAERLEYAAADQGAA